MYIKKRGKMKILSFVLSLLMIVGLVPTTVFAATENGYNLATASSRPYDGTAIVKVTDMIFASAFDIDDVSADAIGTLSSENAGTYTSVNLSEIKPKGADSGYYEFPSTMNNVPTNVTISKVNPDIEIMTVPGKDTHEGQEITVTATIKNNFNNNDGLPTADQFSLTAVNATPKAGTTIVKNGNKYTGIFITKGNIVGQNVNFYANVLDTAINYNVLSTAVSTQVNVVEHVHELWVNGVDISNAPNQTISCGDGTATYDEATSTLTLNNATINKGCNGKGITRNNSKQFLNIKLIGHNYVTSAMTNPIHCGIGVGGKLSIFGSGNLEIKVRSNDLNKFIPTGISSWLDLDVKDAKLSIINETDEYSKSATGIGANKYDSSFTSNNATISLQGFAIGANISSGDVSIENNSFITGKKLNRGISGGNEIDNFVIKDSSLDFHVSGENSLGILNGHEIQIDNSNITITSETSNAIYTDGAITITNGSNLNIKGFYPALFSTLDTTIIDSVIEAVGTKDSGIYSKANITISGTSDINAKGYYAGINANGNITVKNGEVNATSTNDMGIYLRGVLTIDSGQVYAKGAEGYAAIGARYEKQSGDIDPVGKIVINNNYGDINGGKISVSDWYDGTTNDAQWTRSWTSFIGQADTNKLATDKSNALNEITIKIKSANYSKVDAAIEKAKGLNKDEYKDFSAVEEAIKAVVRHKNITEQNIVNGYADAIENAIKALELKPITAPVIIQGANQTVEKGKESTFRSDANFKDFVKVLVDGNEISADNYIAKEGSTIVTLKSEFVETLLEGSHTISIVSTTGQAITEFNVVKSNTSDIINTPEMANRKNPNTGDSGNMVLWISLIFVSACGILIISSKYKKTTK